MAADRFDDRPPSIASEPTPIHDVGVKDPLFIYWVVASTAAAPFPLGPHYNSILSQPRWRCHIRSPSSVTPRGCALSRVSPPFPPTRQHHHHLRLSRSPRPPASGLPTSDG